MTTATATATRTHSWAPAAAIAAGTGFVLMAALVIASEDSIDAPAVVLYLGSIVLALAAAVGTGLRAPRGRRALVAVGLCVALIAWVMGVGDLLKPLWEVFSDEKYVLDSGSIALLGVILLALGLRARR